MPPSHPLLPPGLVRRAIVVVAGTIALASGSLLCAGDEPELSVSFDAKTASPGIGGAYKVGKWTPFRVEVDSSRAARVRLELESVDPDGNPVSFLQKPIELPAGRSWLHGRFQSGRLDAPLRARVREVKKDVESAPLAELRLAVAETEEQAGIAPPLTQASLVVAMLGRPAGLTNPQGKPTAFTQAPLTVVTLASPDELPADVADLGGLDVLVVNGLQELPEPKLEAVRSWVQRGGHLLVSVGEEAEAFARSPWQKWVPVRVTGVSRLRDLSGIEGFVTRLSRIAMTGNVPAAKLDRGEGEALISALDGPILVRAPYGFGRVTMLGVDIDRAPLSRWPSLGDLLRKIVLGGPTAGRTPGKGTRNEQIAQQGLSDLSTQLRSSKEDFPSVHRFTSWMVLGLMLGYMAVLGPLDYFLVHRVLKKPQLTWVTFPLFAAAASLGALWSAQKTNGGTLRVNQIDVLDVDVPTHSARVQSWASVYSPQTGRYEIDPRPRPLRDGDAIRPAARTSWDGVPEDGFGGMYRTGGAGLSRPPYRIDVETGQVLNVPITVWSTKVVSCQWESPAGNLARSELRSPGVGQLAGTFTHHLPGPLTDWVLAYGNRVYLPRPNSAGKAVSIAPGIPFSPARPDLFQRELNGYLTGATATRVAGRRRTDDQIIVEQAPYDPLNRDPLDILRMATFHEKAAGSLYTGLSNHGLRSLEMSGLLDLNRAVLFGRIDAPTTDVGVRNANTESSLKVESRGETFVRIVFAVQQTGTVPADLQNFDPNKDRNKPSSLRFFDEPAEAEIPEER